MSLKPSSAMRLEIDESIIHSQLKFNVNIILFKTQIKMFTSFLNTTLYLLQKEDEEFQQLLSAAISERDSVPVDDFPYKTVKPKPGM